TLDTLPRLLDHPGSLAAFDSFQRRAVELLAGSRTREAFDLSRESPRLRERYGDTHWGKRLLPARRLVEARVRVGPCPAGLRPPGHEQQLPAGHDLPPLRHRRPSGLPRPHGPADPDPPGGRADRGAAGGHRPGRAGLRLSAVAAVCYRSPDAHRPSLAAPW